MSRLSAPWPIPVQTHSLSAIPRVLSFRYELLDDDEASIGTLDGVREGSIRFDSWGAIKASGELLLLDTGQQVDWLRTRVKPIAILESPLGSPPLEVPLGVFLAAAPVEQWSGSMRTWRVEIIDKLSILDQDAWIDESGKPMTFSLPAGSNVVQTVKTLIASVNETAIALAANGKVTTADYVWEAGTTKLEIANALLRYADFTTLWTDGDGNYRTEPYVQPQDRTPVYALESLFETSDRNIVYHEWELDHDIYGVPNRMIAIGQSDSDTPPLSVTVTNEDSTSPFSYQARGRWITVIDKDVEAVDEAALRSYARRRMTMLSSPATEIRIEHPYLPLATSNTVIKFSDTASGLAGTFLILETEVPLDPLGRCASRLERIL